MDTVRAATDIPARLRIVPGPEDLHGRFTGFRDQRSPPPDYYRTNVYSIMGDTPKAARNSRK
jgi:hypothetical protein